VNRVEKNRCVLHRGRFSFGLEKQGETARKQKKKEEPLYKKNHEEGRIPSSSKDTRDRKNLTPKGKGEEGKKSYWSTLYPLNLHLSASP